MNINFCRRCGARLSETAPHAYKCENQHLIFANPSPTVGLFLINQSGEVLLAVRGIEPHVGMLDAFGGFMDIGETLEEGVAREIKEELGLEPSEYDTPQYLTSASTEYEFDNETHRLIAAFFYAKLRTTRPLTAADDVSDIFVTPIDAIDMDKLHAEDIRIGVRKLQEVFSKNN